MLPLIIGTVVFFAVLRALMPRITLLYAQSSTMKQANQAATSNAVTLRARQLGLKMTTALWVAEAITQYALTFFKRNTQVLQFKEGSVPGLLGYLFSLNQVYALYYASGTVVRQVQELLA